MRPLLAALSLPLLLAACAAPQPRAPEAGDELVRVAGEVLATADSTEDVRAALHRALGARAGQRIVQVAGHRFLLAPATLDRLGRKPPEREGWLVAQSLELAEQSCLAFRRPADEDWLTLDDGQGRRTWSTSANGLQFVSVGIELHRGCVIALHVEQARRRAAESP